ncbi:hypothetical protein HPB50_023166 [Hyalomma asiaticum]|uniref:Uncharacterized protein n=1 Tax=Hyalomma asiaticum TaxID=266040 RepID=A0ACB7T8Y8_HYAAI|nr:hypothetical protein HPB50_023166 [Hyalomma asiaticum]
MTLLEEFVRREGKLSLYVDPLQTFARDELCLHAEECLLKIRKQCSKRDPETAKPLALLLRKMIVIVGEVASSLEKIGEVPITDWVGVGEELVRKYEKTSVAPQPPFWAYIPKMCDFDTVKVLGAGGYGVVHLALYKPANLVTTVKLVNMDRFTRQKQAAMDKVLASVVRNPFIVKYYSCFVCKQAYVTVMEYVAGVDLMRVLNHEHYLEIDAVQIIMAQLILALQHMHFKGFLHRDIKVSKYEAHTFPIVDTCTYTGSLEVLYEL